MPTKSILSALVMPMVFSFLLSALAVGSCQQTPAKYRHFLSLSLSEKKEEMRSFSIDEQIDFYLAGMTYVHPPLMELGDVIASEGKAAVPPLIKRLRQEREEFRQMALIYVFDRMNRRYYKLKEEEEAIALLRELTSNMKDRKSEAERLFKDIVENRSVDLERFKEEHPQYFPKPPKKKP